jgi:hypothetical protein
MKMTVSITTVIPVNSCFNLEGFVGTYFTFMRVTKKETYKSIKYFLLEVSSATTKKMEDAYKIIFGRI